MKKRGNRTSARGRTRRGDRTRKGVRVGGPSDGTSGDGGGADRAETRVCARVQRGWGRDEKPPAVPLQIPTPGHRSVPARRLPCVSAPDGTGNYSLATRDLGAKVSQRSRGAGGGGRSRSLF